MSITSKIDRCAKAASGYRETFDPLVAPVYGDGLSVPLTFAQDYRKFIECTIREGNDSDIDSIY